MADIHPGSFVGDSVEEFKKLPTWGKVGAVGVIGVVVFLAIRARNSASAQSASSGTAGTPGSSSPFPMVGNVPLLPSGVNPIYDQNGNLQGYQSQPPATPPTGPSFSSYQYINGQVNQNLVGLVPQGTHVPTSGNFTWNGVTYKVQQGNQGRIWGVDINNPGAGGLLLSGPSQYYPTGYTPPAGHGSGPGKMSNFMENPFVYLGSAKPHLPSTVPQAR